MKNALISIWVFALIFISIYTQSQVDPIDSLRQTIEANSPEKEDMLKYEPVVINKLITHITIDTTGFFDVEENYQVVFNDERRGLLRFLKLKYLLNIEETNSGQEQPLEDLLMDWFFPEVNTRRITIENIDVPDRTFDVSGNHILSDELQIKIGDESIYLEGEQNYTIKYRVKNAFLFRDGVVDFYWNFLGGNWDIPFLNAEFNIYLQGKVDLDSNQYVLYGGEIGSTESFQTLIYKTDTLFGISPILLDKNQDLTLLLHLPENYLPRPSSSEIFWSRFAWPILPAICILIFIIVWLMIGKDKRLVRQVQYNPPQDMDSAMAGFLIDSRSNNRDIISLLPYWAANGIITIREINLKSALNATARKIIIGLILSTLVAIGVVLIYFLVNENEIGFAFLPYIFLLFIFSAPLYKSLKKFSTVPKDMELIRLKGLPANAKSYEKTVFRGIFNETKKTVKVSDLRTVFYEDLIKAKDDLKERGIKVGFTKNSERNIKRTRTALIISLILGASVLFIFYHLIAALSHILICSILLACARVMDKRTTNGDDVMKDLIGFRLFIEKADKPKLEFLLKEDPKYFEKTISYAVAFGMADKWCKKFESLAHQPEWYSSSEKDSNSFGSSFSNILHTATVNLSVSPPGSGGSDSGGSYSSGSSGGGFGGGGGSSW